MTAHRNRFIAWGILIAAGCVIAQETTADRDPNPPPKPSATSGRDLQATSQPGATLSRDRTPVERNPASTGQAVRTTGLREPFETENAQVDRLTASFSDPARPGTVELSLINGGITVTGYEGKEVYIEGTNLLKRISRSENKEKAKGMHRLSVGAYGINVEEKNNRMEISTGSWANTVNMTLRVPRKTSLKLSCINNGDIKVEGVEGDLDVNNINGAIDLKNVSGSVVGNALNQDLSVVFTKVDPTKPMSFSSMNGSIDVTFPALVKADVRLNNQMGEIYTDFEVQLKEKTEKTEENERDHGGKYRIKVDRVFTGQINGGGPEYEFKNFNGDIYIRKK